VLGPSQLPSDVQVTRDLYSTQELERQYENASDRVRDAFQGYADGVNRGMEEMLRERDVPGEFLAVGHVPELWTPIDSVAIGAYMIGYFGMYGGNELENAIRFARMATALGEPDAWAAYAGLKRRRVPDKHYPTVATIARAFPGVSVGAAWWFNDSPYGMREQLEYVGTVDLLANYGGMVSDSRKLISFDSRFEMFRRSLADTVGSMVERGQVPQDVAEDLVRRVAYDRPNELWEF
jgi:hypothetical protein